MHEEAISGPIPATAVSSQVPDLHEARQALLRESGSHRAGEITETWGGDSVGDTARDLVLEGGNITTCIKVFLETVGNLNYTA